MRRQFVVLLGSRTASVALQAALFAILARSLDPAAFGVVMAAIGIAGLVLVVSGGGMPGVLSRARASDDHDVVRGALRLTTRAGVLAAVVLAAAVAALAAVDVLPAALVLVVVALAVERTTDTALSVPIADGDVSSSVWPLLARRAVALVVFAGALTAGLDPLWAYGGGAVLGAAVGQALVGRAVRLPPSGTTGTTELLGKGSPFLITTLAAQSRMLDTFLVAVLLAPAAAGLYAAAAKLVQPTLLIPQTIASLVLPRATRLGADASRRLLRPMLLASLASFVAIVPVLVVAEPLVVLIMGNQYAGAGATLQWLLVGMPFVALAAPLGAVLQGSGRERFTAVNSVVFGVVLLAGVAVGAGAAGTEGAAAALSASYVLRVAILTIAVRGRAT